MFAFQTPPSWPPAGGWGAGLDLWGRGGRLLFRPALSQLLTVAERRGGGAVRPAVGARKEGP